MELSVSSTFAVRQPVVTRASRGRFASRRRLRLTCASLLATLLGCGDSTGPATTYNLTTVGGQALPVPAFTGSLILIHGGHLTLGPGDRAVTVFEMRCASPLPPGSSCAVVTGRPRTEGTYSEADGTVTFNSLALPATFADDEVVIRTPGDYVSGVYTQAWVYRRWGARAAALRPARWLTTR
jgi:hypothetical protein